MELTKVTKSKIKEAAKHIFLWRKIYNLTCRGCKYKVYSATRGLKTNGTQSTIERVKEVIDEGLCKTCKPRINRIVNKYKG